MFDSLFRYNTRYGYTTVEKCFGVLWDARGATHLSLRTDTDCAGGASGNRLRAPGHRAHRGGIGAHIVDCELREFGAAFRGFASAAAGDKARGVSVSQAPNVSRDHGDVYRLIGRQCIGRGTRV